MALRQTLRWNSIFHINETANILFKLVRSKTFCLKYVFVY